MKPDQYARFTKAVADFLTTNHVKPGCHSPADSDSEPFFSWRHCDCCGSLLGGMRETYNFAHTDTAGTDNTFQADICPDCVYFLAYGQLDDATMADLDQHGEMARESARQTNRV